MFDRLEANPEKTPEILENEIRLKDEVVDLLNKGIEEKRKGNLDEAINYYKRAKEILPHYPVIYLNLAKGFILTGKFENAFRNLLTNIHLRLIQQEEIDNCEFLANYQIDLQVLKKLNLNNKAVSDLISESKINEEIAKEINVTFYAGFTYAGMHPTFSKRHKIGKELFEQEKAVLAGKIPNSQNLRQSKFVNLINIIGLKWIIDNLNLELTDQDKISKYYLDSTTEIKDPDTKRFDPPKKEISEYTWTEIFKMVILMPVIFLPDFFKEIYETITEKGVKLPKRIFNILSFPILYIITPFLILIGFIFIKPSRRNKKGKTKVNEATTKIPESHKEKTEDTFLSKKTEPKTNQSELLILKNLTLEVNNATSLLEIISLEQKYSNMNHPYKSYLFGMAYMIKNTAMKSFRHFIDASEIGILYKDKYMDNIYADSVGSSISSLLTNFSIDGLESEIRFNMFVNSYMFLSSVINMNGINSYESYRNRAVLFDKYEENLTEKFITKYLGNEVMSRVLFLSDYFFASKGFEKVGISDDTKFCLETSMELKKWLFNLPVEGKLADSYTLEEISKIGKEKQVLLYNRSKQDFNNNVFQVDFSSLREIKNYKLV